MNHTQIRNISKNALKRNNTGNTSKKNHSLELENERDNHNKSFNRSNITNNSRTKKNSSLYEGFHAVNETLSNHNSSLANKTIMNMINKTMQSSTNKTVHHNSSNSYRVLSTAVNKTNQYNSSKSNYLKNKTSNTSFATNQSTENTKENLVSYNNKIENTKSFLKHNSSKSFEVSKSLKHRDHTETESSEFTPLSNTNLPTKITKPNQLQNKKLTDKEDAFEDNTKSQLSEEENLDLIYKKIKERELSDGYILYSNKQSEDVATSSNLYGKIINISISLIIFGLLMGVLIGVMIVVYLNSS